MSRVRRGIFILPSVLTTASLFCGFYSIISSIKGDYNAAAISILIAVFFDAMDGKVARVTRTVSSFGVEYDSLSDLVAFGVAPGVLAFNWVLSPFGRMGWLASFLFVACGALRLARFNVQIGLMDSRFFNGLPIPGAAGMVAATALLFGGMGIHIGNFPMPYYIGLLIMIYVLSFLMVSNIKFTSFKDMEPIKLKPFRALVVAVLFLVVVASEPHLIIFILFASYVISGPSFAALRFIRKRKKTILEPDASVARGTLSESPKKNKI
ncbi:MAG: CDP-diacylglycerol--serine O-phosphatidyltransferase [Deltaproteobacteria bacterium]|nr:CDP-diacylglycerol--serine O-phosphatidyltransferase [Deltaproteobacteria bacterium]MBW2306293.1 CDP-diacylglycerol--serine O-phosphatidyltransferase [Deltaproteobacteria bacterium]